MSTTKHSKDIIRLNELALQEDSREVNSRADKRVGGDEADKLDKSRATQYRALVARLNYIGQDRTDIANTFKELSRDMSSPTAPTAKLDPND